MTPEQLSKKIKTDRLNAIFLKRLTKMVDKVKSMEHKLEDEESRYRAQKKMRAKMKLMRLQ